MFLPNHMCKSTHPMWTLELGAWRAPRLVVFEKMKYFRKAFWSLRPYPATARWMSLSQWPLLPVNCQHNAIWTETWNFHDVLTLCGYHLRYNSMQWQCRWQVMVSCSPQLISDPHLVWYHPPPHPPTQLPICPFPQVPAHMYIRPIW